MLLAYCIYIFLLILLYTASSHNYKLLVNSNLEINIEKANYKYWRWPLIFAFIPLIFFIGFRYDVGVDYMGYFSDYLGLGKYKILRWFKIERYEWGYQAIVRVFLYFNIPAWVLFSLVGTLIWCFFIQSFKPFPYLLKWGLFFAFTTGFFFATNNGMRQSIALAIFMYSIKFIEQQRSFKRFFICIIIASSFHTSIFLVFPFYFFIHKINLTKVFWIVLYILTYIIGNKLDIRDVVLFGLDLFPKYQHYSEHFLKDFSNPASIGLGNIYTFGVSLSIIIFSNKFIYKLPTLKVYYNLFYVGAIIFNFFWKYAILGRVYYLFIWFNIFCLAAMVYYFGKSKNGWFFYALVLSQILMFFYKIYINENLNSPYSFLPLEWW